MKDDQLDWSLKKAAMSALKNLIMYEEKNLNDFMKNQEHLYFLKLLKQIRLETTIPLPIEAINTALEILKFLAVHPTFYWDLANPSSIEAICMTFQNSQVGHEDFKIISCNVLLHLWCNPNVNIGIFNKAPIVQTLYNLLMEQSMQVKNSACILISFLCRYAPLAEAFLEMEYLQLMLKNRSSNKDCPYWEKCIDALLNSHLSYKFAFTGRLNLSDIVKDGFYVTRRNISPLPMLNHFLRVDPRPLEPVYVVNTVSVLPKFFSIEESPDDKEQYGVELTSQELRYNCLQPDQELCRLIQLFQCKLVAAEWKNGVAEIPFRAKKLAEFVVCNMSGRNPARGCMEHRLEIHLKEIKCCTGTSVIPLGLLKIGSYLERALLYKVIADKIALPAALVRGEYGRAWIEIVVPQANVSPEPQEHSSDPFFGYLSPHQLMRLLKPNFIVDLMHRPGSLIPIDSEKAKAYRSGQGSV